jgi:hypothetical protein
VSRSKRTKPPPAPKRARRIPAAPAPEAEHRRLLAVAFFEAVAGAARATVAAAAADNPALKTALQLADILKFTVMEAAAGRLEIDKAEKLVGPFVQAFEAGEAKRKQSALTKHWTISDEREIAQTFYEPVVALLEHAVTRLRELRATRTDESAVLATEILDGAGLAIVPGSVEDKAQDPGAEINVAELLASATCAPMSVEQWKALPPWRGVPTHWRKSILAEVASFDEKLAEDGRTDVKAAAKRILAMQLELQNDQTVHDRLRGK